MSLALQASFDGALTFCSVTGQLMTGCGCPEPEGPALERAGCCVRVESARLDQVAPERTTAQAPSPVGLAAAVVPVTPDGVLRAERRHHEGDPPPPERLFLRLRTLVL